MSVATASRNHSRRTARKPVVGAMMRAIDAPPVVAGSIEAAAGAKLRYVSDEAPGIPRRRSGKSFAYLNADGKPVRDAQTLGRIRSLVIPPAWTEVWICPLPN